MADEQAAKIGRRVRYWRLRRNLTRKNFADMVGRSTSWLDKVETGERNLLRLPMLERVSQVLQVEPNSLTDEPAAQRAANCVDATEVRMIRAALSAHTGLTEATDRTVNIKRLNRQAEYLDLAWANSHFTTVARHLPDMINRASSAVNVAAGQEQIDAHRALVTTYRLASSMLLKFDANQLAWLAADRAINTALMRDDTWALARATRSVARAMGSNEQPVEALAALVDMADRIRPELAENEASLIALHGMLFLAASMIAADQQDADLAHQMHVEAERAAGRLRPDYSTYNTYFGMANVTIHRVGALIRLHESGKAVEYAATIDPKSIAVLPPERRVNYLLDMAEAQTALGNYREGTETLLRAEQAASEEVHCRPLAHGVMRSLLRNTTGEAARSIRQLAERAGVAE